MAPWPHLACPCVSQHPCPVPIIGADSTSLIRCYTVCPVLSSPSNSRSMWPKMLSSLLIRFPTKIFRLETFARKYSSTCTANAKWCGNSIRVTNCASRFRNDHRHYRDRRMTFESIRYHMKTFPKASPSPLSFNHASNAFISLLFARSPLLSPTISVISCMSLKARLTSGPASR